MGSNDMRVPHSINMEGRKTLSVGGVKDVESFDEREITACTDMGTLVIKGENLNIKKLNLDTFDLDVTGKINALDYCDGGSHRGKKILKRIFK